MTLERFAGRRFMLQHVLSNIPFDGPTPAADDFAVKTAKEMICAPLTDNGAFIQTADLLKKAEWTLLTNPPTAELQLRIVFTAEEFLDYGFEALEQLRRFTQNQPDNAGDPVAQCLDDIMGSGPRWTAETRLLWRDSEADPWWSAAFTRGSRFDRDVRGLPPGGNEGA